MSISKFTLGLRWFLLPIYCFRLMLDQRTPPFTHVYAVEVCHVNRTASGSVEHEIDLYG